MENVYFLPIIGVIGTDFKFTDLLMHINNAKESGSIVLMIDSLGGDVAEGLKMRDALINSKKIIIAKNSGDVASIAVSLWLTAQKENRHFDPAKGQFLIHNPYINPKDLNMDLDSSKLEFIANEIRNYEKELLKQYCKGTGSEESVLKAFMAENKALTAEQITNLGFANIQKQEFKAVAYINNQNNMNTTEIEKKLTVIETMLESFKNLFIKVKNLVLQDTNGKEVDFQVETPDLITEGTAATVDGSPAEGAFIIDGITYTFKKGLVVKIEKPADEMEALKQKNAELEAQLTAMNKAKEDQKKESEKILTETKAQFDKISNEFISFKNLYSSGDPKLVNTPGGGQTVRKAYKS